MKIIKKPWGQEELIEVNKKYMVKKLTMKKNHRCSLQYHKKKIETIYVLKGKLEISFGKNLKNIKNKTYKAGDTITIKNKIIHRMKGLQDSVYLECSTPELTDVIRIKDDYNRKT